MPGVALVGPRIALGLVEGGPKVLPRFFRLKDGNNATIEQEDAVGFLAVQVIAPALAGHREVGDVPATLPEVGFDQELGFVFVNLAHGRSPTFFPGSSAQAPDRWSRPGAGARGRRRRRAASRGH